MYSFGIEEEYFVFDARTRRAVRRVDKRFLNRAHKALGDRVKTEMLQSQIEVVTPPCDISPITAARLGGQPPSTSCVSPPWAPSRSPSGPSS